MPGAPEGHRGRGQGGPAYGVTRWRGFFAPATIPAELSAKIAADIQSVLAAPETRDKLQAAGASLFVDSQANFKRYFAGEIEKWRGVVKKANLKLE